MYNVQAVFKDVEKIEKNAKNSVSPNSLIPHKQSVLPKRVRALPHNFKDQIRSSRSFSPPRQLETNAIRNSRAGPTDSILNAASALYVAGRLK